MTGFLDGETRELASPALIAYSAMEATKRRHFDYLNLLEARRKNFNLEASDEQQKLLASLLTDHDQAVVNFKTQSQLLQESAPDAHISLFKYIGMLNELVESTQGNGQANGQGNGDTTSRGH